MGGEAVKSSCCTIYLFVCAISNGSLLANQLRVNSTQQKQFEMVNNNNPLINVNLVLSVWISDLLRNIFGAKLPYLLIWITRAQRYGMKTEFLSFKAFSR